MHRFQLASRHGATRTLVGLLLAALAVSGCDDDAVAPAGLTGDQPIASSEDAAVTPTRLSLSFQAGSGAFLSAAEGGGGALTATASAAKAWERFAVVDPNGGGLQSGDEIYLAAFDGSYLSATDGGGGAIGANGRWTRGWEAFRIVRLAGAGTIQDGDRVALRTSIRGTYVSATNNGGGAVNAAASAPSTWETFVVRTSTAPPRARVLHFLRNVSGTNTVSGVHNRFNATPSQYTEQIHAVTGNYPGLWSGDFLFEPDQIANRQRMIDQAKVEWSHGALINIMYHACPPTQGEACQWDGGIMSGLSDAQWNDLVTDGGTLNRVWKSRLDAIVPYLQQLKDAGIAPLFRPHHEMNQGVFWWAGRRGTNGTSRLFQITHDYLVNEKGLDNLIWVWDVQDLSWDFAEYRPPAKTFDVAALDVYGDGFTQAKYDAMLGVAGGKPIAIGECNHLPTAANLAAQPFWAFFMSWSELTFSDNSAEQIRSTYYAPSVMKLDNMPGWN
jgi:mannan endo-1,4-beta-mannosidase